MRAKNIFIGILLILLVWLLFLERTILSPFVLGAIFAYIFNPFVNFFTKKLKTPRILSIVILYAVVIAVVSVIGTVLAKRIAEESLDISRVTGNILEQTRRQTGGLPDWLSLIVNDLLITLRKSRFINLDSSAVLPIFSQAISQVIGFFIFLFSGFYFLKDGEKFVEKSLTWVSRKHKVEVEILLRKINIVLGGYLRGEILLIAIVSAALYIALTILGIRFAITLAIFSGMAEIVPVIGPILAGATAALVAIVTNTANFGLNGIQAASFIVVIYFVFRQLEDYFIIPQLMEKITKLPPFVIFFAVIAGGHIAGVLGLILAVPTAAALRLLIEFFFDRLADKS